MKRLRVVSLWILAILLLFAITTSLRCTLTSGALQYSYPDKTRRFISSTDAIVDVVAPVKVHIFMDGTWLYYSLVKGRENSCPMRQKFGESWTNSHRIDWPKIAKFVTENIALQLRASYSSLRPVEVTRTSVFTSSRADTHERSMRSRMIEEWQKCNFEVHHYETSGLQEKCVDIALAVEMLHAATVPGAYDIACIVTGDKDFIPALQKTRLAAKKVALCSLHNSCNNDLIRPEMCIRDFDPIWIDDYLEDLVVPRFTAESLLDTAEIELMSALREYIDNKKDSLALSRDLGRMLKDCTILNAGIPTNALEYVKTKHVSLWKYFSSYDDIFRVQRTDDGLEFSVSYINERDFIEDEEDSDNSKNTKIDDMYCIPKENKIDVDMKSYLQENESDLSILRDSLSVETVSSLKLKLKEKGLKLSGTKPELIERLLEFNAAQTTGDVLFTDSVTPSPDDWLLLPLKNYIGETKIASSRDLGRMLNLEKSDIPGKTANQRMKDLYGSLRMYLQSRLDIFEVSEIRSEKTSSMEYFVSYRNNGI